MSKLASCCGNICSACSHYPKKCGGCAEEKGKVFKFRNTGSPVCPIYHCCVKEHDSAHCGGCTSLPCHHYVNDDPEKTPWENSADLEKQLKQLETLH